MSQADSTECVKNSLGQMTHSADPGAHPIEFRPGMHAAGAPSKVRVLCANGESFSGQTVDSMKDTLSKISDLPMMIENTAAFRSRRNSDGGIVPVFPSYSHVLKAVLGWDYLVFTLDDPEAIRIYRETCQQLETSSGRAKLIEKIEKEGGDASLTKSLVESLHDKNLRFPKFYRLREVIKRGDLHDYESFLRSILQEGQEPKKN